ncbi:hypothetical protein SELSPUOL_00064 [Selenomonas sputigena ATCC 35185]|uniref:Uncharacterized protein n=1 Tax=Selenomonas sputigena (strain ATCC 35185 / DSM 20758 / CCUG 44933 / VPI D19B-28) TaxID=546271 RepID=C9LRJ8_SELS3|nr:hypothetical protein SELSPUOL_00064 [Selenomonas sputigena ATCC 35185]
MNLIQCIIFAVRPTFPFCKEKFYQKTLTKQFFQKLRQEFKDTRRNS